MPRKRKDHHKNISLAIVLLENHTPILYDPLQFAQFSSSWHFVSFILLFQLSGKVLSCGHILVIWNIAVGWGWKVVLVLIGNLPTFSSGTGRLKVNARRGVSSFNPLCRFILCFISTTWTKLIGSFSDVYIQKVSERNYFSAGIQSSVAHSTYTAQTFKSYEKSSLYVLISIDPSLNFSWCFLRNLLQFFNQERRDHMKESTFLIVSKNNKTNVFFSNIHRLSKNLFEVLKFWSQRTGK